jgi:hypothetical protein
VASAEQWAWGSLYSRCNKNYPIPLTEWPIPEPSNWIELVNTPQTEKELSDLRKCIRYDQPIGTKAWAKAVAPFLGMTLLAPGRPKK